MLRLWCFRTWFLECRFLFAPRQSEWAAWQSGTPPTAALPHPAFLSGQPLAQAESPGLKAASGAHLLTKHMLLTCHSGGRTEVTLHHRDKCGEGLEVSNHALYEETLLKENENMLPTPESNLSLATSSYPSFPSCQATEFSSWKAGTELLHEPGLLCSFTNTLAKADALT